MSETNPAPITTPPQEPAAPVQPAPAPTPTPPAPPAPAPVAPDFSALPSQIREAIGQQTETIIGGVREALSSVAPSAPAAPAPTPQPNAPTATPPSTAPAAAVEKGPGKFASWFLGLNKAGE